MASSPLQVSLKNTFLSFSDSPRPSIRRAHTSGSMLGSESEQSYALQSPISLPSPWSGLSTTCSPRALSPQSTPSPKAKQLDSFVATVGSSVLTTVMIRGIPKNYDQDMLLSEVQAEGLPVNFLYLPPGKTKSNRSYGFVNFETEQAAEIFLYNFDGHRWRQRGASKLANCGFATLQGFKQNIEFFSKQEVAKGVSKRSPWIKH